MSDSKQVLNPITALLMLLGVAVLAAGCGVDESPTAATEESLAVPEPAPVSASGGGAVLTFSPEGAAAAAKVAAAGDGVTRSGTIGNEGGEVRVRKLHDPRGEVIVTLQVPPGALAEATEISMTVYGLALERLAISFEPSGLVFLQQAELVVRIDEGLVSRLRSSVHVYGNVICLSMA